ncbi:MAG: Sua5/YciO/YrdC/YwlC family protein [Siphonobacter sp.]
MNTREAIQTLRSGEILIYPTDTVWGLGGDATRPEVVNKIRQLRTIPADQGLVVLVWDASVLDRYVVRVPELAYDLIEYAEDPLTIIFPKGKNIAENVLASDGSIAIRVVKTSPIRELVESFGRPIVSTQITEGSDIPRLDPPTTWKPSQKLSRMVRLGLGGEFEFIRK